MVSSREVMAPLSGEKFYALVPAFNSFFQLDYFIIYFCFIHSIIVNTF